MDKKRVGLMILVFLIFIVIIYFSLPEIQGLSIFPQDYAQIKIIRDIKYAKTESGSLLLDLYLPQNNKNNPIILSIHGGAWMGGDKNDSLLSQYNYEIAKKGFAVASINYRLSTEAKFPAQLEDINSALSWLNNNAKNYNLDSENIGVWGASAGGHLASLIGLTSEVKIKAVADIFGPVNFLTISQQCKAQNSSNCLLIENAINFLLNCSTEECPEIAKNASPQYYITNNSPAFLIIHGNIDDIVPLQNSLDFQESLKNAGSETKLIILKETGHWLDFPPSKLTDFFSEYLKNE